MKTEAEIQEMFNEKIARAKAISKEQDTLFENYTENKKRIADLIEEHAKINAVLSTLNWVTGTILNIRL